MKKAIFTVVLGGYDKINRPVKVRGWDNILFTDHLVRNSGWTKVFHVNATDRPDIESRRYKWLSHKFLPKYDMVCYVDGNMRLRGQLEESPFRILHDKRKGIMEEAEACNGYQHRCTPETINEQIQAFKKDGFKDEQGLYYNGFFCRYHSKEENQLCELVFDIVQNYTPRDQLALPYAMWKLGYIPEVVKSAEFMRRLVRFDKHRIVKPKLHGHKISVHHITPGRSDKNLGKAINDIINVLPNQDWICIRDIDTIPMYHEKFYELCEKIANSAQFDLIGCMTNRLGLPEQLVDGMYDLSDITEHRAKAIELYNLYGDLVIKSPKTVAGLFMLFPKSTWLKVGGFLEGGIKIKGKFIDYQFCKAVQKNRLKIGIAQGIYLFHWYRFDKDIKDIEHLF
jgi:hypothetical protein